MFVVRHQNWPESKGYQPNHNNIPSAIEKGAAALMIDTYSTINANIPTLIVENTYDALHALAIKTSELSKAKRVLVVGSYGKTAFKVHLWLLIKDFFNIHKDLIVPTIQHPTIVI